MVTLQGHTADYEGPSTDEKPVDNIEINAKFYELDTGKKYYFNGETWSEIGGSTT